MKTFFFLICTMHACVLIGVSSAQIPNEMTDPNDRATLQWLVERSDAEVEVHYRGDQVEWIGFVGESKYTCGLFLDGQGRVVKAMFNKMAIDNAELKKLAGFQSLEHVNCQHNFGMNKGGPGPPRGGKSNILSGAGWIAFKDHPLQYMRLAGSPFDGDGLRAVAQIKSLKTLNVFHTAVTDEDMAALRGHPSLEEVVVGPMWDDKITGATVEHLSQIPNIKRFKVVETYLSYEGGLEYLAELGEQIESIDLGNTVVPEADLERLRCELPDTTIDHEPIAEIGQLIIDNWKGANRKLRSWAPAEVIDSYVAAAMKTIEKDQKTSQGSAEAVEGEVGEFSIPQVSPLNPRQLEFMRRLAKEDPEASALAAKIRRDANSMMHQQPQPMREIFYEGLVNTDPRRVATVAKLKDMADVACVLRFWQVSGDPRAARFLKRYILAWSDKYAITGNDVNENKFHPLLSAYYSLRSGFSTADRQQIDDWVGELGQRHAHAVQHSTHLTNRYSKHARLTAVCGMILNRDEWVELAVQGIRRFVTESLFADGSSLDLWRRDALAYHVSGLRLPLELAMLLGERSDGLYSWVAPKGGSLKKSVDYVVPYAMGQKTHNEWINTKVELDRRRAAAGIEKYQPGKSFDPRNALKLMEKAAYFDPELMEVVRHLSGEATARFPTWQTFVNGVVNAVDIPLEQQSQRMVPSNRVIEFDFVSEKIYDDPFNEVTLDAAVTAPSGRIRRIPAFWAGGQTWKLRYASHELGTHGLRTQCNDRSNAKLHNHNLEFQVTLYNGDNPLYEHGPIRVAEDRRHLAHADGTPFFWLGDTWWMGLTKRLAWPDDFHKLAADRLSKGFNVVQVVAGLYPDMPAFDERGANEAGFPWTKDYSRIRPEYFDSADRRLMYLADQGFVPCIVGAWGYHLRWMSVDKLKQHWRYLIARYGALPVVWCAAGEASMGYYESEDRDAEGQQQIRDWSEVIRYMREVDGFQRLITIHPGARERLSSRAVTNSSLIDFELLQTGHRDLRRLDHTAQNVMDAWNARPAKPTINGEFSYEQLDKRDFGGSIITSDVTRRMFWVSIINSGSAGATYGANGIWQVNRPGQPYGPSPHGNSWGDIPWNESMKLPGSMQVGLARDFLMKFDWQNFRPLPKQVRWSRENSVNSDDEPIGSPVALGIPDETILAYIPDHWPVQLAGLDPMEVYSATFFDPVSGRTSNPISVRCTADGHWKCDPRDFIRDDWVVVLQKK